VDHDLEVFPDPAAVAARAAGYVAGLARAAVAAGSRFSFTVSGGQTTWTIFRALAAEDMPWASAELFQLDERVAPAGDADRNLTHLRESLGAAAATVHPMPAEEDLAAAARLRGGASRRVRPGAPGPRPGWPQRVPGAR
jgi:6-phosphogluconolactonase/glucosamine-6-phosphate isomerase/deaminase